MKKILTGALLCLSIFLVSCGTTGYVTDRPTQPVYVRPASPGAGYIWVDGDWYYRGNNYTWREGYWSRPRGNRQWETGTWIQQNNRYAWHRGHWRR